MQLALVGGPKLLFDTDRLTLDKPLALAATTGVAAPSLWQSSSAEVVVTAGTGGFRVNLTNNAAKLFSVSNAGATEATTSLSVNGPVIASRQFTVHVGTNQNLTAYSNTGVTAIEAMNDAGNAFVNLTVYAATVTLNGTTNGGALQNAGTSIAGWNGTTFFSAVDIGFDLGSTANRWRNVYANQYYAGASAPGVTCNAAPTAAWRSVNGIVTVC